MRPQGLMRGDPFPHMYFQYFFKPETYEHILLNIPERQDCTTLEGQKYKEFRRIYPLHNRSGFWGSMNNMLTGDELQNFLFSRLDITVSGYPRAAVIRDLPGYSIEPHPDVGCKVCTVQIFLPRSLGQEMLGTRLLDGAVPTRSKQIGFIPNTGYAFKVTDSSWHDRPPTPENSGIRDSLIICYFDTPEREFK